MYEDFVGIDDIDLTNILEIEITFQTASAQDFVLDAIRPCLGAIPPSNPTPIGATPGPSPTPMLATATPGPTATLMPLPDLGQLSFFYNEQVWSLPWNYTEFLMPDLPNDGRYDGDKYLLTSGFEAPYSRYRRWQMPDSPLPNTIPPHPSDLVADHTEPLGTNKRAAFWFDPDDPDAHSAKLWLDETGARLFGGQPETDFAPGCDPERPGLWAGAGNPNVIDPGNASYPVEVWPYTDPWAPFSPQHPHAPRSDIMSANPAYMDEFRNSGEELVELYKQLSNNGQNAREKVYLRFWYESDHLSKIRYADDCERDLSYPALMQEYTYLMMDTTDQPISVPPGRSQMAFPMGTTAEELPLPLPGGQLSPGGELGAGLTTFDANFDGAPDAVTVHSEQTLNQHIDDTWQATRPTLPGPPPPAMPGPVLDFDGDGNIDELDEDDAIMSGDELVILSIDDLVLDMDESTPHSASGMFLDHLVTVENVTRGERAQMRFWFTGGRGNAHLPQTVGGVYSLEIGDAVLVDHFQDRITQIKPGEGNVNTDGAWFVFLKDVSADSDQVTIAIGRALGATHSAIDDGMGHHDLEAGDPWYLKRFYVDGHEYDITGLMVRPEMGIDANGEGGVDGLQFITVRTSIPVGDYFNSQDTLLLQGYFTEGDPDKASVMPPHNVDHTIAIDYERQAAGDFAHTRRYDSCVGDLAPFGPLMIRGVDGGVEARYGSELREIWSRGIQTSEIPETEGWRPGRPSRIRSSPMPIAISRSRPDRFISTPAIGPAVCRACITTAACAASNNCPTDSPRSRRKISTPSPCAGACRPSSCLWPTS